MVTAPSLKDSTGLVCELPVYDDLLAQDVQKQIQISPILKNKFNFTNKLIKELRN